MLRKVFCAACSGIEAFTVTVEVDISDGICFYLVGLPDVAVKESQQRIGSALNKYGYRIPGKRVVINLAPANIKKQGSAFDVPIALGIICAAGEISSNKISQQCLNDYLIMGELALDGSLRPIQGALPIAIHAKESGFKGCIMPLSSAKEAAAVDGIAIYAAGNFGEVIDILSSPDKALDKIVEVVDLSNINSTWEDGIEYDLSKIKGQTIAKRGLEIAAAGGHNIIMSGSPGCGKTILAKAIKYIMPPMSREEALETGKIYSISGQLDVSAGLPIKRPFREPHHTSTVASLVGGGPLGLPGEISLAHNGILFADEFPEFGRAALEVLRQPLEEGFITICRVRNKYVYPASFMLVATMNPCPCGLYYDSSGKCTCTSSAIEHYRAKISGPLMDRIDIQLSLKRIPDRELIDCPQSESSAQVASRVLKARKTQLKRFAGKEFYVNARIPSYLVDEYCKLGREEKRYLIKIIESMNISARAYDRILKISRTIADLDEKEFITLKHISEALQFRMMDKDSGVF